MFFSKNLRYLRKKAGYSQEFIADKFGYKSYTTVQKWETGVSEPSLSNLKILSDLFGIDMNRFVNRDLEANPEGLVPQPVAPHTLPEQTLISKYRQLDPPGKQHVDYTVDRELERTKTMTLESVELNTVAAHGEGEITKDDIEAVTRFLKEQKLERMKNER